MATYMMDRLKELDLKGAALNIAHAPADRDDRRKASVNHAPNIRPRKPLSQRAKIAIGILVVSGLTATGWQRWRHAALYARTDNAQIEGTIIPIRAKLSGTVLAVPVNDNDKIEAGALLVQLRSDEFEQRVIDARSQLFALQKAAGKNGIGELDSQIRIAAAKNQSARATVEQLRTELENARLDYRRIDELAKRGLVSAQQRDNAHAQMSSLQQQVAAAQSDSQAADAAIDLHHAELKIQDYKITAAQAALTLAEIQLDDASLHAPRPGFIARKYVEPGQFVIAGQQLMTLTASDESWVIANVKETDIGRVRVGQPALITADAYPDATLTGIVQSIEPATGAKFSLLPQENATGNFTKVVQRVPVKIHLDARDAFLDPHKTVKLRPGMSVYVEIKVGGDDIHSP